MNRIVAGLAAGVARPGWGGRCWPRRTITLDVLGALRAVAQSRGDKIAGG